MIPRRGLASSVLAGRHSGSAVPGISPTTLRVHPSITSSARRSWSSQPQPSTARRMSAPWGRSSPFLRSSTPLAASLLTATTVVPPGSRTFSVWGLFSRGKPAETMDAAKTAEPTEAAKAVEAPMEPVSSPVDATTVAATTTTTTTAPTPVGDAPEATAASTVETLSDLQGVNILDLPEQLGYLHTLGLDFGWGPTSTMQWLLEHVHVYSGFPWWASILATQFLIRLLLFKPLLLATEHSTRMQILRRTVPEYDAALTEFRECVSAGSRDPQLQARAVRARQTYLRLEREHGVKKLYPFWNFLQIPIGIGMFRLLNGMSSIPVPGLENGGALWFTNLALPDPYYLLPLAGPVLMYASMRATLKYSPPTQQQITKVLAVVLGPVSLFVTAWLPAGVQFYFCIAAIFGMVQNLLMLNPTSRQFLKLPPIQPATDLSSLFAASSSSSSSSASASAPGSSRVSTPVGGLQYEAPRPPPGTQNALEDMKAGFRALKEKASSSMDSRSRKRDEEAAKQQEENIQKKEWEALRARMASREKAAREKKRID